MIDIFNEVYNSLVKTLATYDTNIGTSSVYLNMPSKYPFVSMEEIDNSVDMMTSDCCHIENCADISFEINVYTQGTTKKSNGDSIAKVVDNYFASIGFVRQSKNAFQSEDEKTYRIVIRYGGVVSQDHIVYRR